MNESRCVLFVSTMLCALGCSGGTKGAFTTAGDEDGGGPAASSGGGFTGFADAGGALQAHIQVNGTDLPCGRCAVLIAQATGGREPYTYQWSDPSLGGPGPHSVCPQQATQYSVVVTDSSNTSSGEIQHAAETAKATADLTCQPVAQDAGDASTDELVGCVSSANEVSEPCAIDAGSDVTEVHSQRILFDPTPGKTYQFNWDQVLPIQRGGRGDGWEFNHNLMELRRSNF